MWTIWWVWLAGALILGVLEVFVSGYILLGFAIGAAITGILLAVGGPLAGFMIGSLPKDLINLVPPALPSLRHKPTSPPVHAEK